MTSKGKSIRQPVFTRLLPAVASAVMAAVLGMSGSAVLAQGKAAPKDDAARTAIEPGAKKVLELDPKNFDRSENIDHAYWPLKPGNQWTTEGYALDDEGKKVPHRIVFTVTDLVKVIGGVRARVIYDADFSKNKMTEQELTYFAQDKQGNVWHLGQYREVYEDEFVGGRIWTVDNPPGSKAGIYMPRVEDIKLGTVSFSQGYAPSPFNWTDRGRVFKVGQKDKVKAGSYDDVVVFEEFDGEKVGTVQLKSYARGIGAIRIGTAGKPREGSEEMELVKFTKLGAKELEEVNQKAFELEKRGTMFPANPPMERVPLK
jgi:hypothetical protein